MSKKKKTPEMMVTHMDWTPEQQALLDEQEGIIENGRAAFDKVTAALVVIKSKKLYLKSHANFGEYCVERWGFTRQWAHKLLQTVEVDKLLDGVNHGLHEGAQKLKEASARAKLELSKLPPGQVEKVVAAIQETKEEPTQTNVRKIVEKVYVPSDDEDEDDDVPASGPPAPNDARCERCGKLKGGKAADWEKGLVCLCNHSTLDLTEDEGAVSKPLVVPETRAIKPPSDLDNHPVIIAIDNAWNDIARQIGYLDNIKPLAVYQRLRQAAEKALL